MLPPLVRALLRTTPTIALIPNRAVISVAGSQASEFLNGITATTVPDRPFFTTFLHAQGRVLYDAFVYTHVDPNGKRSYLVEYDGRPSEAAPLLALFKRYVLRAKVKVRDVSGEYDVWGAWGSEAEKRWETRRSWRWGRSGAVEPVWADSGGGWPWGSRDGMLCDRRAVGMGERMLVAKGERPPQSSTHDLAPPGAYALHRILNGVAEGMDDIPPMQAFPMDSNLDLMGGLDFRKGCYVGQELTVRTYHTGVLRKRILPVIIHKPDVTPEEITLPSIAPSFGLSLDIRASIVPAAGDAVPAPRPRGTGKLLTSAQGVGLALLRLEHAEGARQGTLKLALESPAGTSWGVSPWWPDWWPSPPTGQSEYS